MNQCCPFPGEDSRLLQAYFVSPIDNSSLKISESNNIFRVISSVFWNLWIERDEFRSLGWNMSIPKHRANIHPGTAASLQWACCRARIFQKNPSRALKSHQCFYFVCLHWILSFMQRPTTLQRWHCCINLQPEGGTLVNHYSNLIF